MAFILVYMLYGEGLRNFFPRAFFNIFFNDFVVVVVFLLLFFKVESSSRIDLQFQARDQSTVKQRTETTVDEHSQTSCVRAHFPK